MKIAEMTENKSTIMMSVEESFGVKKSNFNVLVCIDAQISPLHCLLV